MSTSGVPALAVPARVQSAGDGAVRVTVPPGEDVLLPAGVPLGDCRADLAALLRRPELRHTPLAADGVPVADTDVVGDRPLLPGAVIAPHESARRRRSGTTSEAGPDPAAAPAPGGPERAVLGSPWLVARADGTAAGSVVPLGPGSVTALTDAPGPRTVVRVDPRRTDRVTVRIPVRIPGQTSGRRPARADVRIVRAGARRRRRVGFVRRRWRPGDRLEVAGPQGTRSWTLHPSGDVARWLEAGPAAASAAASAGAGDGAGPSGAGDGAGPSGAGMLATAAVPVVGSLVLAAMLRQPAYALFSLMGVLALVPQLLAARRRRHAAKPSSDPDGRPAGAPAGSSRTAGRAVGDAPGPLVARVLAAHQASDGAWGAARERAAGRSRTGPAADPGTGPGRALADLVPDGAIALVGPRAAVLAAARSVVVELATAGGSVAVVGAQDAWSWCRWLPGGGPPVLIVDAPDAAAGEVADATRREDVLARGGAILLCLPDGAPVPAWCRTTWRVTTAGTMHRSAPDGSAATGPVVGVTPSSAERAARLVAGLAGLRRSLGELDHPLTRGATEDPDADPADPRLPAAVPLLSLLDDAADPGTAWDAPRGWAVPLGVDGRGRPVTLDLVADGPHLLVAGTTGAGKSELLQSMVLGLAARRSPRDLALALVDFKGGASFGECGRLPHVVGQVTDLDPGLAGRALAGLRAELHRRERVLARHGVADLAALPAGLPDAPPRLVVVVDEFRALADDLPEFLPGLLRVAAQGRSLGVHLVLATQRPAGAVSADVRANVSARLALRVVDAADSLDVVETAVAARIPAGAPGRAVLRLGSERPVVLQCAHAAGRPGSGSVVRRAPVWGAAPQPPGSTPGPPDDAREAGGQEGVVHELVSAARRAASRRGLRAGRAPWLPPLPERVRADEVVAVDDPDDHSDDHSDDQVDHSVDDPAPHDGLPVALGDDPGRQRRALLRWDPATGHLGVVGRARSGRTTTLLTLARAALARGWHVHVLAPAATVLRFAALDGHPGLGTVAGPQSPRRAARLLRLLATRPQAAPVLVLVDGVEELRAALAGPDLWDPLTGALGTPGVAFALAADGGTLGGLASRVGPRLVLLGRDAHDDVVLGAPSGLAGRGGPAGRAAWLGEEQLLCQVLLPDDGADTGPDAVPGAGPDDGRTPPLVVRPLPATVEEAGLVDPPCADAGPLVVPVGVGGDDAAPVGLNVAGGALVTGPRGSGRTTVLRVVARALAASGRLAAVVARDAALRQDAGAAPAAAFSPAALRVLLDELAASQTGVGTGAETGGTGPRVVVVDDLEALAQQHPLEADRLAELLDAGWLALVASATTTGALLAHRGPLAELRAGRTGVVLHPAERGADEVLGTPLTDAVRPGPLRPGSGALVVSGQVRALQAARPGSGRAAALSRTSPRPRGGS